MSDCKCGARLECVIGDYWQCADGCDTKDTQEWKPGALDKLAQDVALDEDSAVSALALPTRGLSRGGLVAYPQATAALYSSTPAGRFQQVTELAQFGVLRPDQVVKLLNLPDLEQESNSREGQQWWAKFAQDVATTELEFAKAQLPAWITIVSTIVVDSSACMSVFYPLNMEDALFDEVFSIGWDVEQWGKYTFGSYLQCCVYGFAELVWDAEA